jgi:glyoxylase-like metal-dependent hydrolase (beta-lactamase superfamily II)
MEFRQYYLGCLSHASYLIGDEATGRAVVVDPQRDVDRYLDDAAAAGLTIERVIETHFHADFVSGHLELAERADAVICYGEGAETEFPIEHLRDGERITLGQVQIEVRATPGHTPESVSLVVYEHPDDRIPYGVLTGDTLSSATSVAPICCRRRARRRRSWPAISTAPSTSSSSPSQTRPESFLPTAPARRAARAFPPRRSPRSANSGAPTTPSPP